MIRVLLVDDHKMLRESLSLLLTRDPDMRVVGEASDACAALRLAAENQADVVLLDVGLPDVNGTEVARHLVRLPHAPKVLALSAHDSDGVVTAMLQAGASGYLVKTCCYEELLQAVRAVFAGQTYVSKSLTHSRTDATGLAPRVAPSFSPAALTDREREVLQLIAQSYTTKEIADRLALSPKTVSTHRTHVMEKLDLTTVAALTRYAVRENLTAQPAQNVPPAPPPPCHTRVPPVEPTPRQPRAQ